MTALALAGWTVAANPDGTVTIGAAVVPAWLAADLAARIAEAADAVPEAVAARLRTRGFVDRLFAGAQLVPARSMVTGAVSPAPAYREGLRVHVRLGDTVTAWCLRNGDRARGMLVQWAEDAIFGHVCSTVPGWPRVSVPWGSALRLADRAAS